MAYSVVSKKSGKTYFLHSRDVELNGGRMQTIYYFAGDARANATRRTCRTVMNVTENARTGPCRFLRKKR